MNPSTDRMFLEGRCPTLDKLLTEKLVENPKCSLYWDFQDFECRYKLSSDKDSDILYLTVSYPYLSQVLPHGSQALLERAWSGMPDGVLNLKAEGENLNITVNLAGLGTNETGKKFLAQRLGAVRPLLLTGPLVQRLHALRDGAAPGPPATLRVRRNETTWILPKQDRVVVIFSVHTEDESTTTIARTFCQEFVEAHRGCPGSLPCSFTEPKEPPSELAGLPPADTPPSVGYLSMTISDQKVKGAADDRIQSIAFNTMTLQNFFDYHLKSSMRYLHSRMRAGLDKYQQMLNRARPEQQKERRNIKGKVVDK